VDLLADAWFVSMSLHKGDRLEERDSRALAGTREPAWLNPSSQGWKGRGVVTKDALTPRPKDAPVIFNQGCL
jgi:hypothetical protein